MRLSGLHLLNVPWWSGTALKLARPFIKEKTRGRVSRTFAIEATLRPLLNINFCVAQNAWNLKKTIHGCHLKNNPFLKMSPDAGARQQPLLPAQTPPPKAAPGTTGGREGGVRAPALGKPSAGWVELGAELLLGCSLSALIEQTSTPEEGNRGSQRSSVQSGCVCECLNGSSDGHSSIMPCIVRVLMLQSGHVSDVSWIGELGF